MKDKKQVLNDPQVLLSSGDGELEKRLGRELKRTGIAMSQWAPGGGAPAPPSGGYHVLLLDLDDPSHTAASLEETVTTARGMSSGVAVHAVGLDPTREQLLHLLEVGINGFIQRPVDIFELAAGIRNACERSAVSRFSADVFSRLKDSQTVIDRSQIALHDAIVRSNEDLQTLNQRLYKVVSQLKTLYHMGRDLANNENWSDALDRFLMALVSFLGAEGAALILFSRNNSVLAVRSSFQIDQKTNGAACAQILSKWKQHTRSAEIHSLESYTGGNYITCLECEAHWRMTIIPLRHRNRPLGFLLLEKDYRDGFDFKSDYDFLNTLQTIFVEEIANASYISELRHLSRFNNKVLDNIRSGVITTDLDGTVNYSNEWARGMCPSLREPKSGTLKFDDLFVSRQFGGNFYDRVLRSRKNSHVLEVECSGGAAEPFPARLRTAKMYDDNLGGMVLVAIFEDLTEQRRMEVVETDLLDHRCKRNVEAPANLRNRSAL